MKYVRTVVTIPLVLFFLFASVSTDASITLRTQEPLVLGADRFPAFDGIPIDRIVVYRWDSVNGWIEVPSQVDEVVTDLSLRSNYDPQTQPTCLRAHDPCERTYRLDGVEPDGFNNRDELVVMPRDGGAAAAPSTAWVGVSGVDTMSTRYRLGVPPISLTRS